MVSATSIPQCTAAAAHSWMAVSGEFIKWHNYKLIAYLDTCFTGVVRRENHHNKFHTSNLSG